MAQSNRGENLFRAICNATADAEDHDQITPTPNALMQAIHLDGYVKVRRIVRWLLTPVIFLI